MSSLNPLQKSWVPAVQEGFVEEPVTLEVKWSHPGKEVRREVHPRWKDGGRKPQ